MGNSIDFETLHNQIDTDCKDLGIVAEEALRIWENGIKIWKEELIDQYLPEDYDG